MKTIGYLTVTIALLVYSAIMNGWALTKLWAWFIVPTFSAPTLSVPAAIGIYYLVGFFKSTSFKENEKPLNELLIRGVVYATVSPLVTLACAAVVRIWM